MSDFIKVIVDVGGQVNSSFKNAQKGVDDLKDKVDDLNKKGIDLKVSKNSVDKVDDLKKKTDGLSDTFGKLKDKSKSMFSGFLGGSAEILEISEGIGMVGTAAVGAALGLGVLTGKLTELSNENKKFRDQLSKTWDDFDESVDITSRMETLSKKYGVSKEQLAKEFKAMTMAYGASKEDAMKAIEDTIINTGGAGIDRLGDYSRYAGMFKSIGVDLNEAKKLIIGGVESGISEDKLSDLLKSGQGALTNMDDETKSYLDQIGINSKKVQKDLKSGRLSIFELEKKILKNSNEQLDAVDAKIVQSKIFGGVMEEVNGQQIQDVLEMKKIDKERYAEQQKLYDQSLEYNKSVNKALGDFEGIGKWWNDLVGDGASGAGKVVADLISGVAYVAKTIVFIIEALTLAINGIIKLVDEALVGLYNGFVWIANKLGASMDYKQSTVDFSKEYDGFEKRMSILFSDPEIKKEADGQRDGEKDKNKDLNLNTDLKTDEAKNASVNGVARVTSETKSIIFNIDNLVKIDEQKVMNDMDVKQFEAYLTNVLISSINNSQTQF